MRKKLKVFISSFLAVLMIMQIVPFQSMAEEPTSSVPTSESSAVGEQEDNNLENVTQVNDSNAQNDASAPSESEEEVAPQSEE